CSAFFIVFFFSSRRRHTRFSRDWSSDVCSSDLMMFPEMLISTESVFMQTESTNVLSLKPGVQSLKVVFIRAHQKLTRTALLRRRSEERRVGKECRARRTADD